MSCIVQSDRITTECDVAQTAIVFLRWRAMISQYLILSRNGPERGDADYLNAATKGMRNADQLHVDNKMNFLKVGLPFTSVLFAAVTR